MLSIIDRVDSGIALLDDRGPAGWRSRIDVDALDVGKTDNCVVAQVFGDYYRGINELDIGLSEAGDVYGFDAESHGEFKELTDAWYFRLTELRKD